LVVVVATVEERLALALEAAQLGTWTWDMARGTTTWDVRLEELHGLPPGGFGGTYEDWVDALHPEDRASCLARVERALQAPGPYELLHRTTWPDGSIHWIECRGRVLVDESGAVVGTTGVAGDVTARKELESAVTEQHAAERQLVDVLQTALLPATLPPVAGASMAARYRPAAGAAPIGGDWYAVIPLGDGRAGIGIGDVAGHGLDAVADMASARFSLRALALGGEAPDVVLQRLNQVVRLFGGDTLITALYGILDPAARTWTYASAGQCAAILRSSQGEVLLDALPDPPLGIDAAYRTFEVDLPPDAILLLYTDGLVERRGEAITEGIQRLLATCRGAPRHPAALCDAILRDVADEATGDDIALVAVHVP
jgi:PAS domain S-box-containing protein